MSNFLNPGETPWTLSKRDPHAVPNARISLAVLRVTRRLKGAFPEHCFDDLGNAFAPALARIPKELGSVLEMPTGARNSFESDVESFMSGATSPDCSSRLGRGLARGVPAVRPLADAIEVVLEKFVRSTTHPSDKNIEILTRLLGFSPQDAAILRLASALSYGSVDRSLFGFVDSRTKLMRALPALIGAVTPASWRMFDLNQPLQKSGLLEISPSRREQWGLEELLRLSPIGGRLLCVPHENEQSMSQALLVPLPEACEKQLLAWPHLGKQEQLLEAALSHAVAERTRGVNILLYGAPGVGKTVFAQQLIRKIGATGFAIAEHNEEDEEDESSVNRLTNLRLCQTFAGESERVVLVLDEAEDIFISDYNNPLARIFSPCATKKALMNRLLETNRHPVIWISNQIDHLDPAYLRRFTFCLEFPRMPLSVRQRIAEAHLLPAGCSPELVAEASANDALAPALLASAVIFARMARTSDLSTDTAVRVHLREQMKAMGEAAASKLPRRATRFDLSYLNIEGNATPERILASLPAAHRATILFAGPPGTGKTQLAAEIADVLNRELVYRTASDINSMWYGESEQNVARMFRECDPETQILFVDEAETLLGSRDATGQRADRAVTGEFLRHIEAFEGVFVCATNYSTSLDAALMRRFMFRLNFRPLDPGQRYGMFCETALGWSPSGNAAMPKLDPLLGARLARLDLLTPGDFANAAKRIRALDLALTPAQWLEEMEAEHGAKPDGARSAIGFV